MPPTAADRHDARPTGRRDDRADPIPAGHRERGHRRCGVYCHVGLAPADRPEIEAARPIDEDGDIEVAFLDRVTYVRLARPRQDRPVHPPHVVARLVRSSITGLDSMAQQERRMATAAAADDLVPD